MAENVSEKRKEIQRKRHKNKDTQTQPKKANSIKRREILTQQLKTIYHLEMMVEKTDEKGLMSF